jgi:REP element-mobilizing transposase RayT
MPFFRRRLPHWIPNHAIIFVTWRLFGSMFPQSPDVLTAENTGRAALLAHDDPLDRVRSGPVWLAHERVAGVVASALQYGETPRQLYELHAWAIMPNHVHVIFEPHTEMPPIMQWLKGRTARTANRILGRTGLPFWQDESWDHWIRSRDEFDYLVDYVERNPVKAGLVAAPEDWPWSSARVKPK